MTARYAGPVDPARFGEYAIRRTPDDPRPLYRFAGRVTADGSSGFRAEPGRYHVYAGWFCPWSQRVTLQRALNGLEDVVSVSYVDNARDGRGWAFRETHGPDPVNGFTLLREAYEATEVGFDGHISVPTLWDRETRRVVSNDYRTIGLDLATEFRAFGNGVDTYPAPLRTEIEQLDTWVGPAVNQGGPGSARDAALRRLDERLAGHRYLVGSEVTEADVRLWVTLVRLPQVAEYPNLWGYARDLYRRPAFAATTDFASFTVPGTRPLDWAQPHDRARLAA
ncbi:MAG: glutathione S-transferase C-terminal domain-containing protein [Actinobacteria bacterium]|nr:glutathione S-transferase C-terminal domain-containing protein [Actinomycetota bacterium]